MDCGLCEKGGKQHESFFGGRDGGAIGMKEVACDSEVYEGGRMSMKSRWKVQGSAEGNVSAVHEGKRGRGGVGLVGSDPGIPA